MTLLCNSFQKMATLYIPVPTIHDEERDGSQITNEHSQNHSNEDPMDLYSSFLYGTFVPSTQQRLTEEQIVRKSTVDRQSHQNSTSILTWPQIGCTPIISSKLKGTCRAFPTLFPTGAADFAAPRLRPITQLETTLRI